MGLVKGVVTATPLMFGANPANVKDGPRKGLRTLPDIEDHARALVTVLDDRGLHAALRQRGLARAAGFTWERTTSETLRLYRELAEAS